MRPQYIQWHGWEFCSTQSFTCASFLHYIDIFLPCWDQNWPSVMLVSDYSHWLGRPYHANLAFWPVCSSNFKGLMVLLFVQHEINMFLKSISLLTFFMRPASWSGGQSFWLIIMRSRVRFPALPWEFFLVGEDRHGNYGLAHPGTSSSYTYHQSHHWGNVAAPH